jgi:anaerobic magnesium-protoporphyrin IX monomethyl ester cyclase
MPGSDSTAGPTGSIKVKVLLTRAHYRKQYRSPGFPVGLALIASYLESKGVFVGMIDLAVQKDWEKALRDEMEKHAYDVVGITFQITQYPEACRVASFLKKNYPSTKIVAGGSFASSAPEECIRNQDFTAVCYGEGELTLLDLLRAWQEGRPLESVNGITFRRDDGQAVKTQPRALIEDLNEMPLPAYHLLDLEPYIGAEHTSDFTGQKNRCMELITSRGCPYHCIYCHSFFGKRFRSRSPQHVFDEMLLLHNKYHVREFVIWDDTFTMDIQRAKDICDLIIDSKLKIAIQLRGGVHVERMDEELMSKLKLAGTETMCVGIESAVSRIQKLIKKNLKIEKVEELLRLAKKYNITTIGLMMMGFPGESVREIKESIRWASRSSLNYTFISLVTPYPGTELYDIAVRDGYYKKESNFENMSVMVPHLETSEIGPGRLKWLQIQAYLRFYMKPRRLRKLLSSTYTIKAFASSLLDYLGIAASYYSRRLSAHPR